ncbi:MAG TPA: flavodoxin, partial [Acidimicrobiaceae bacterium]|nr:flavodoxin [Acidimicrobiaceae bacterium]
MACVLVVWHSMTGGAEALADALTDGASDVSIEGVDVVRRRALDAGVDDVLAADGYLLATPENFGYMSGAMKDFFDRVYYPCLDRT